MTANEIVSENLHRCRDEYKSDTRMKIQEIQEEFARELGVQPSTVKTDLSGSNQNQIPYERLIWYAEKFGVSLDYLITGKEFTPKKELPPKDVVKEKLDNGDAEQALLALATLLISTNIEYESNGSNSLLRLPSIAKGKNEILTHYAESNVNWIDLGKELNVIAKLPYFSKSKKYEMAQTCISGEIRDGRISKEMFDGCLVSDTLLAFLKEENPAPESEQD